jgi:hypothetical protein
MYSSWVNMAGGFLQQLGDLAVPSLEGAATGTGGWSLGGAPQLRSTANFDDHQSRNSITADTDREVD